MAEARAAAEGERIAWLIRCIPAAVWSPKDLPEGAALNPFREAKPESEAMAAHKAAWAARKFRVLAGG